MRKLNKSGSIGPTLTWVVAVLIIFFLLIIFLVFAGALSATKKPNRNILLEEQNKDLFIQKNALSFLNKEVEFQGQEMSIYDLIKNADLNDKETKTFLLNQFEEMITLLNTPCYFIMVNENWDLTKENIRSNLKKQYSNLGRAKDYLAKNGIEIIIDKDTKIQFYFGECKND